MTTNHHTPIATGASRSPAILNAPLSELDTRMSTYDDNVAARYGKTTAQSLSDNTLTTIDFNNSEYDPLFTVTTGASWVFTVPFDQGGLYLAQAQLTLGSMANKWAVGDLAELVVLKNGSIVKYLDYLNYVDMVTGSNFLTMGGQVALVLAGNDTLAIAARQNSGQSQTIANLAVLTYCSINRLGDSV